MSDIYADYGVKVKTTLHYCMIFDNAVTERSILKECVIRGPVDSYRARHITMDRFKETIKYTPNFKKKQDKMDLKVDSFELNGSEIIDGIEIIETL